MSWPSAVLGDVVDFKRQTVAADNIASGTSYVGLEHVSSDGTFEDLGTVAQGDLASSKFAFSAEHVLFGKLRPYLRKIARPGFSGVCSTDILPLRPKATLDRDYLFHVLRRQDFIDLATARSSGANLPRIAPDVLAELAIPLPPISEQRRIAAILDKADALRAKRRLAIAKLDQLLQSVFLEMFGDPVTNPKGWPKKAIGELASFITSGSRGWAAYYSDTGALFVRIQNLVNGELDLSDCAFVNAPASAEARRTKLRPGDVLVSITADLGRTAVVPADIGEAHINQHLAILRLSGVNPAFVSHYLASVGGQRQFAKMNRGGVKAGLNFDDLKSLEILMPPQSLQADYLTAIEKISAMRSKYETSLDHLGKTFSGIQHSAFQPAAGQ